MFSSPKKQLKSGTLQSQESIQTVKIDSSMKRSDKRGLITQDDLPQEEEDINVEKYLDDEENKSDDEEKGGKIDFNS
jgi:hypothetical protein